MIQIIPPAPPKRTVMGSFLSGIAQGIPGAVQQYRQSAKEAELMKKKAGAAKLAGLPEGAEYLPESVQAQLVKGMQPEGEETPGEKALRELREAQLVEKQRQNEVWEQLAKQGEPAIPETGIENVLNVPGETVPKEVKVSKKKYPRLYTQNEIDQWAQVNSTRANAMQTHNDRVLQQMRHDEDVAFKEKEVERKEKEREEDIERKKKEFGLAETLPIRKTYADKASYARNLIQNKKLSLDLLRKGKVDDPVTIYLSSYLPKELANKLLSSETQVYKAGLFEDFGAVRQMFSGATRVKELELLEDKLATLDKSHKAKEEIIATSMNRAKRDIILSEEARKIEKEHPEYTTLEFEEAVNKAAQPRIDKLFNEMLDDYEKIYIKYAPKTTTYIGSNGRYYENVDKKDLEQLFKEAKENGIELRIK